MPKLGEIKTDRDLGYRLSPQSHGGAKYIWFACPECGKERWVPLKHDTPKYEQCGSCRIGGL